MKNLIWVGPGDYKDQKPLLEEGLATEADIQPGHVVEYAAANAGYSKATSAATVFGILFLIANKNELQAKEITDLWTLDETMTVVKPRSGEYINVLVETGQALDKGTALTRSATAGLLTIAATDGTEQVLCYSDEVVTTTATQLVRVYVA